MKKIKKYSGSLSYLLNTFKELITKKITLNYAVIKIYSQFKRIGKKYEDGVDWDNYSKHYEEELRILAKNYTDRLDPANVIFLNNRIQYKVENSKTLHPNHELLYETILQTEVNECMEIGCGGGDHLINLKRLNKYINLQGVDLSENQIKLLKRRNPELTTQVELYVNDITKSSINLPKASLIFTQAVLMHISEKDNRFQIALRNIFNSAKNYVVLMENWTQHNFLLAIQNEIARNASWGNSYIYFNTSKFDPNTSCMIISKSQLNYTVLSDYEQLLMGKKLEIH